MQLFTQRYFPLSLEFIKQILLISSLPLILMQKRQVPHVIELGNAHKINNSKKFLFINETLMESSITKPFSIRFVKRRSIFI